MVHELVRYMKKEMIILLIYGTVVYRLICEKISIRLPALCFYRVLVCMNSKNMHGEKIKIVNAVFFV